jgi:hypothetical protein
MSYLNLIMIIPNLPSLPFGTIIKGGVGGIWRSFYTPFGEDSNFFNIKEIFMNQRVKSIGILIVLGGMLLFGGGCVVLGAGAIGGAAASAVYLDGELYHAYSVPIEKAWKASEEVVAEKNMKVTEKYIENMERNRAIKGKTQDGKDFQIRLEAKAADVTVIRVRIGALGDEDYSQKVHDWIRQRF